MSPTSDKLEGFLHTPKAKVLVTFRRVVFARHWQFLVSQIARCHFSKTRLTDQKARCSTNEMHREKSVLKCLLFVIRTTLELISFGVNPCATLCCLEQRSSFERMHFDEAGLSFVLSARWHSYFVTPLMTFLECPSQIFQCPLSAPFQLLIYR